MITTKQIQLTLKLQRLLIEQKIWSEETFGADEIRGPVGALKHLEREAVEAVEAFERIAESDDDNTEWEFRRGNFKTELADCFLLLLDASRRGGVELLDLITAAEAKMVVNRSREPGTPAKSISRSSMNGAKATLKRSALLGRSSRRRPSSDSTPTSIATMKASRSSRRA